MAPYQERVIVERTELNEKINKLDKFLQGPAAELPGDDRRILVRQLLAMNSYLEILDLRIVNFSR